MPSPEVQKIADTLTKVVGDLVTGQGFSLTISDAAGLFSVGKKLKDQEGAGKTVWTTFLRQTVTKHPEVVDLIFEGLPALARARLADMVEKQAGVKDAGEAAKG